MDRREFQRFAASLLAGSGLAGTAWGAQPTIGLPTNLAMPTSGGQQVWADVRLLHDWRIQRNVLTGHFRLLDGNDRRQTWGTLPTCEKALEAARQKQAFPANQETAVVLLHGLFRTRRSMRGIASYLQRQTNWQIFNFGYPSTRASIADHAATLSEVVKKFEGIKEVHFVAHSLGNLVIRHWLGDIMQGKESQPAKQKIEPKTLIDISTAEKTPAEFPKLGRIVMLGPPNHRPALAQALIPFDRNQTIAGESGRELQKKWGELSLRLATPPGEFGILAGGLSNDQGHNPLIPGDDDMVVGVKETKLTGARDFHLLPVIHSTMMDNPKLQKMACQFLQKGFFTSIKERQPLG